VELISPVIVHGTQGALVDCADCPSQARSCVLVSLKMYAAIDARAVDIVVHLLKRGVLQNDAGRSGVPLRLRARNSNKTREQR
jgi:hypothetical protein